MLGTPLRFGVMMREGAATPSRRRQRFGTPRSTVEGAGRRVPADELAVVAMVVDWGATIRSRRAVAGFAGGDPLLQPVDAEAARLALCPDSFFPDFGRSLFFTRFHGEPPFG